MAPKTVELEKESWIEGDPASGLASTFQGHRRQSLTQIGEVIIDSVADWIGGAEQPDDVTVLLARAR